MICWNFNGKLLDGCKIQINLYLGEVGQNYRQSPYSTSIWSYLINRSFNMARINHAPSYIPKSPGYALPGYALLDMPQHLLDMPNILDMHQPIKDGYKILWSDLYINHITRYDPSIRFCISTITICLQILHH